MQSDVSQCPEKVVALFSKKQIFTLAAFLFPPASVLLVSVNLWRLQKKSQAMLGFVVLPFFLLLLASLAGAHAKKFPTEYLFSYIVLFVSNYSAAYFLNSACANKLAESGHCGKHIDEKHTKAVLYTIFAVFMFFIQFGLYKNTVRHFVSALYFRADRISAQDGCDASLRAFKQSYEFAEVFNAKEVQAASLARIGDCEMLAGDTDKALEDFAKALSIVEATRQSFLNDFICKRVSYCYVLRKDYAAAIKYKLMAIGMSQDKAITDETASTWTEIAALHMKLADNNSAIEYYVKALRYYNNSGNKQQQAAVSLQLGDAYRQIGREDLSQQHLLSAKRILLDIGNIKQAELVQGVIDRRMPISY